MTTAAQFVQTLVERVPVFEGALREHLRDHDELLPHVLMGDITRAITDLQEESMHRSKDAERSLAVALGVLEDGVQSRDREVRELIIASFLENLDRFEPSFGALRARMGPALSKALEAQDQDRGTPNSGVEV
jgi:hypothetical protein